MHQTNKMACYEKAIKIDEMKAKLLSRVYASVSFGKDSVAMTEECLRLNKVAVQEGKPKPYPIDQGVFADTGFEYPYMYEYIEKITKRWKELYNFEVTILKPKKGLWEKWFYGKATRGKWKGKPRGQPLIAFPCWFTREVKVKALENYYKDDGKCVYIGIAYDEQTRIGSDPFVRYPLNEWKWSELDCARYLKKHDMWNDLYNDFDRLGCYMCQKQSDWSLYIMWKKYPREWEKTKYWDAESMRISGHGIKPKPMLQYEQEFKDGKVPKRRKNFVAIVNTPSIMSYVKPLCKDENSCDAVGSAFEIRNNKIKEYEKNLKNID